MTRPECSIDGCDSPARARGWCKNHHQRWLRHGDPLGGGRRFATPEESFQARATPANDGSGCILWTGSKAPTGHGIIGGRGGTRLAYRYAWEKENGSVPEGMLLDHACRNPSCVNVEHLRLADKSSNGANRTGAEAGRKHYLPRGVYPSLNKYQVKVQHLGKQHYLGTFETVAEASAAADAGRARLFGEFAGLGAVRVPAKINEEDYT